VVALGFRHRQEAAELYLAGRLQGWKRGFVKTGSSILTMTKRVIGGQEQEGWMYGVGHLDTALASPHMV
jgi:hypothetical protein